MFARFSLLCLMGLAALCGYAQQDIALPGVVVKHNSRYRTGQFQYISGASVRSGATAVQSDAQGKFRLVFADGLVGETARITARKADMELVNRSELRQATVLGRREPLHVVMADKGELAQAQMAYYQIAEDALYAKYEQRLQELRAENVNTEQALARVRQETNQEVATLREAAVALEDQLNEALELAKTYTEEIAAVNLDFASDRYVKAYEAFERGELDMVLTILSVEQGRIDMEQVLEEERRIRNQETNLRRRKQDTRRKRHDIWNEQTLAARAATSHAKMALAREHYQVAYQADSSDVAFLVEYGQFLHWQNHSVEALSILKQAIATTDDSLLLANVYQNLGVVLADRRQFEEALSAHRRALLMVKGRTFSQLDKADPSPYLGIMSGIASVYSEIGKQDSALHYYALALETLDQVPEAARSSDLLASYAKVLSNKAVALYRLGGYQESVEVSTAVLSHYDQLIPTNPDVFKPLKANTLENVSGVLHELGDLPMAMQYAGEGVQIYREYAQKNPERFRPLLAFAITIQGTLFNSQQAYPEAIACFQEAAQLFEPLIEEGSLTYREELSTVYNNWNISYARQQKLQEAYDVLQKSEQLRRDMLEDAPDLTSYQQAWTQTMINMGSLLNKMRKFQEAKRVYAVGDSMAQICIRDAQGFYSYLLLGVVQINQALNLKDELARDPQDSLLTAATERLRAADSTLEQLAGWPVPYIQKMKDTHAELDDILRKVDLREWGLLTPTVYLKDSLNQTDSLPQKIGLQQRIIESYEGTLAAYPQAPTVKDSLQKALGQLAQWQVYNRDMAAAQEAATRCLDMNPHQAEGNRWLAPALLLQGKFSKARKAYQQARNRSYQEEPRVTFQQQFLADLEMLEEMGISHPDFSQARDLLQD